MTGRSLEEIDEIFAESKSIFDPVHVAKRLPHRNLADFAHMGEEDEKTVVGSIGGEGSLKAETTHVE